MGVLIEQFKSDFKLTQSGGRGWNVAPSNTPLYCPFCKNNNGSKLAFIFSERCASFHCPKCGNSCRLEKYLWLIKKQNYISYSRQIRSEDILKKKELIVNNSELAMDNSPLDEVSLPLFFKRIKYSKYLQSRGAKLELYKNWIIGKTDFDKSLKDYLIFVIPENGTNVGWVARSLKSKKEIEKINKNSKYKILRWRNSKSDFGRIVFGLDEITSETEELIIVEGITSKMRIDCELELYKQNKTKCCCTFGKKMTAIQLQKIKNKGINVSKIILFYDSDAIDESKRTAYKLQEEFNEVLVAFCNYKNEEGEYKDAGDLTKKEMLEVFKNLKTPFIFFESKMNKKKLY